LANAPAGRYATSNFFGLQNKSILF